MTNEVYKTLLIDPPWLETGGGKIKRGADRHYPLMKTDEIISYLRSKFSNEVEIAFNAHLYLWVTNNFMPDGLKVCKSLGFDYKTMITWFKIDEQGHGNIGLGQYFRGITEHCLFAVKGVLPYKTDDSSGKRLQGRTGFYAPRQEHSRKPEEIYRMIEAVSYEPRLELFARSRRAGWDSLGQEVDKFTNSDLQLDWQLPSDAEPPQGDNQSTADDSGEADGIADLL